MRNDPWQVRNLATDPAYASELTRLRAALEAQMRAAGDLGLLPERELHARSAGSTPYAIATNPRLNPFEDLRRAADLASRMDPRQATALGELLRELEVRPTLNARRSPPGAPEQWTEIPITSRVYLSVRGLAEAEEAWRKDYAKQLEQPITIDFEDKDLTEVVTTALK